MKICDKCGASNINEAKFCNDCGSSLKAAKIDITGNPSTIIGSRIENPTKPVTTILNTDALKKRVAQIEKKRQADVMFVLDCTGSMQGEIDAIRDAIIEFADTIESQGVRVRVGLIEFRDRLIGEEHRVLKFGDSPFTNNPKAFREQVMKLQANGGGDAPESSLDALMLALRQPFNPEVNKVIVLITDAPPHIPDKETKSLEEVISQMQKVQIQQFYLVFRYNDKASQIYLKFLDNGRKGNAFDIGSGDDFRSRADNFKKSLMALGKTISIVTQ